MVVVRLTLILQRNRGIRYVLSPEYYCGSEDLEPLVSQAPHSPPPHEVISYDRSLEVLWVGSDGRRGQRCLLHRRRRLPEVRRHVDAEVERLR